MQTSIRTHVCSRNSGCLFGLALFGMLGACTGRSPDKSVETSQEALTGSFANLGRCPVAPELPVQDGGIGPTQPLVPQPTGQAPPRGT